MKQSKLHSRSGEKINWKKSHNLSFGTWSYSLNYKCCSSWSLPEKETLAHIWTRWGHLCPGFFSLDHINYARWLSVHIRDLANLKEMHPDILQHFEAGAFVARKTINSFSGMSVDQAHEQMNALMKGDGDKFFYIINVVINVTYLLLNIIKIIYFTGIIGLN